MNDRYVHLFPLPAKWDHRHANLVTLGRHLVIEARKIEAARRLAFEHGDMRDLPPPEIVGTQASLPRPPLAFGPAAGLPPQAGEDWPAYCSRVFGIPDSPPTLVWLQSPMWQKTDPGPVGAALRIAYMLDYGVPHDHVEIAMGQAHTDYDENGFLWEKLDLAGERYDQPETAPRRRKRPVWVGAVELDRRRSAIRADLHLPSGEMPFSAGLPRAERVAYVERVGPIPGLFSDFLLFSGRRTQRGEVGAYADRLPDIDRRARDRIILGQRAEDDPVPPDAIFIGLENGNPEFILAGPRQDSPVFRFDAATGAVRQVDLSIFEWIERFMQSAEAFVATPPPASQPPAPSPGSRLGAMLRRFFG